MDVSASIERQAESVDLLRRITGREFLFQTKEEARAHFARLSGLLKNLNYSARDSQEYADYIQQIEALPHMSTIAQAAVVDDGPQE